MSNTVPIEPLRERLPDRAPERERTRHLSPAPRPAPRRGLSPLLGGLVAVGVVLAILATQLGLSIAVSKGAYEARALEIEERDLGRVERVLSQNVDKLASPQNLAENAAALGMVQNAQPATLRLSDGAILGSLESTTSEARANLIPNATLDHMPVIDAEGLLVSRDTVKGAPQAAQAPVRWKGKLPAPETR